jgi:hypothetical protein
MTDIAEQPPAPCGRRAPNTFADTMLPEVDTLVAGSVTDYGLCRSFRLALLLTGNLTRAEAAMHDALILMKPGDMSDNALFAGVIATALTRCHDASETDRISPILPVEMRRVLRLCTRRRQCFVLRLLAGLSREQCAQLLRLDLYGVDEAIFAAVAELSGLGETTSHAVNEVAA